LRDFRGESGRRIETLLSALQAPPLLVCALFVTYWMVSLTKQPEVIVTESELSADVIQAIAAGRKIEAIKILREATGLGLANAKVLIDRASRVHGPKKPQMSAMTESSGAGKLVASLIAAAVLGAACFFYLGN